MVDLPEVCIHDQPKARKEHKCCECRGLISAGEKYHKFHGIWDGSADTFKVCEDCEALRSKLDRDARCDEATPFGYLVDTASDAGEEAQFQVIQLKRGVKKDN